MGPCSHAPCAHLPGTPALHRRSVRPDAAFGKFRDARQQPETRKSCPFHAVQHSKRRRRVLAADTGTLGAADLPPEPEEPKYSVQVFSRIREKDPYRLLGVDQEATFEEVQDARNYLYEEFRDHGRSREAIEMAFDEVLKQKMKSRHRYGFQPPKSGRRTDAQGDPVKKSLWEKFLALWEPHVSRQTLINEGVVFLIFDLWAIGQSITTNADPILPFGFAFCYAVYRINDKRQKRNPEGPFFLKNAVFGAIISAIISIAISLPFAWATTQVLPLDYGLQAIAAGISIIMVCLGSAVIFAK